MTEPTPQELMEAADAMIDALCDHQAKAFAVANLVAGNENLEAQRVATTCMTILMAICKGKVPHVRFE